jgi:preprotein translocase subunit SecA
MRPQGRVLSSITLQNLVAIYPFVCGMTGTAATQAGEFSKFYKLDVEVIPTNRAVIRADDTDILYATKSAKEDAVVKEIARVHLTGQPILAGTSSVEESEDLSARLTDIPHAVLNARNEEEEAAIVAQAGQHGAVTISTNMAGRGVDIQLGPGVADLGGLYVIGMNRHEARRIDNQLRGRAGRQGDPGRSRFFISVEDDLLAKYSAGVNQRLNYSVTELQRLIESQNLETRLFLDKYEAIVEGQRNAIQERRNQILESDAPELERMAALSAIDDQWANYLEAVADIRAGIHWQSYAGHDPLHAYLTKVDVLYREMDAALDDEIAARIEEANAGRFDPTQRGATWTYLTTDTPFGTATERIMKGIARKLAERSLWA